MLLEVRQVSKRFGAVQALAEVDFEVDAGEVVALVGDNGAGKSSLVKAIAGIYPPDAGEIRLGGAAVGRLGPRQRAELGISTVYQDLALCENLDVVANLFLGRELGRPALDELAMEQQTLKVLGGLGVTLPDVRAPVSALSGGQRQSVAVARSVMWNARVVLLDEPTAALGVAQTRQVLELIQRLKEQGKGVVVISHNLADVFEACDRVVVLRQGRRVGSYAVNAVSREQIVAAITGASA